MSNSSQTNHGTVHKGTTHHSTTGQPQQTTHGDYHMKQFNREYDPYRNFLVNKGPRDPSSAPQAAMDSLGKHLSVLQSMENKNINHAPQRRSA